MIDTHVHCLPAVDDGPADEAGALELLQAASDAGLAALLATPHYYPGLYETSGAQVRQAFERLSQAAGARFPGLQLHLAREVAITDRPLAEFQNELACDLPGPTMLIELPAQIPYALRQRVFELRRAGYTLVLAHPERCPELVESSEEKHWLLGQGVYFQLTAPSLLGVYGRRTRQAAWRLLEQGYAHLLASDAHSAAGMPLLARARKVVAARAGDEIAALLTRQWPAQLLAGTQLKAWELSAQIKQYAGRSRRGLLRKLFFRSKD